MNLHRLRVASIWAVSAWPAINYLTSNWIEVMNRGARSLLSVVLITLGLGLAGHFAHRFASRRGHGPVVVMFWLASIGLLFNYSAVSALCDFVFESTEFRIPPMVAWGLVVVATFGLIYRYRHSQKLQVAGTTFGVVTSGSATVLLLMAMANYERPPAEAAAMQQQYIPRAPRLPGLNVYYIVLDAYAGREGLKRATGFDNAEFYARMAQIGFTDLSTEKSNYLRTIHSLGGIFALDYPQTDDPATWKNTHMLYPDLFEAQRAPALVSRLNAMGYTAWHSATVWGGCAHQYLGCLGAAVLLEPDYVTQSFLASTPVGRPLMYLVADQDNAFHSITSRLPMLLSTGKGMFLFAHHMAPHPPFMADANCLPRNVKRDNWNGWDKGEEQSYVGAIKCVNTQVERTVDLIIRLNPNALIVLQGDHGSAFSVDWEKPMAQWSKAAISERSSFLNLVRAPADCKRFIKGPMGQINTARFVVACVEGREPEYLPEVTYMTTYSRGAEKNSLHRASD